MVFFSDMDPKRNFDEELLQTRYINMVIALKLKQDLELSRLEELFAKACEDRKKNSKSP
jgi:hypothetical protein